MTTARKLILAGTALVLIAALIGGAAFVLGSSNSSTDSTQSSLSVSGSGSRRAGDAASSIQITTDEVADSSASVTVANDTPAASAGSTEAAGAPASTTGATSGAAATPAPSGSGTSPASAISLPPILPLTPPGPITPIAIAPILFDVLAPSVSHAACGIWNFFTVDISDPSGVSSATVSYSDGGTIRTATLDHGPGTIWSKVLVHNSSSPLAWITVHATDTFGNTAHVTVGATC